ncbi:glycine betaine/proline transport system substrate-binding protein [Nocardiopsis mwathae]|uniref:Glycine betaine/proline transport system substrate-binding protein n=1 Tax=Nocardiopsis mwathae TaxID=1472723 RepID=A0A7X0D783_9ACTN|nr:glycine betaine ABC transporter substrate-binding protein [Nocardiopsis mwathae]MBB6174080.1 glycine betaine/proline transport system substrate-binding protein [Nocardiopsis mwathae]
MSVHSSRRAATAMKTAAISLTALLAVSCGSADSGGDPNGDDKVRIALNGWVGYEADAAVLSYLIENELGEATELVEDDEESSWSGLADGSVDVILENWGHEDLMELYGDPENQLVVDGGPNGNSGGIGWYIPQYLVDQYPGIDTYQGLQDNADIFSSAQGSDMGRFLAADPTFVTQDQGMINHFGMDLEIEYAGSEEEQLQEVRKAYDEKEPVLFYFYEPQWIHEELDLVKVDFPDYVPMCEIDPEDVGCDYPEYELNKIFRKGFADENSPAYQLLDNWTWTNEDQDEVARMIADEGMDREDAARTWVEANPDVWKQWLPASASADG